MKNKTKRYNGGIEIAPVPSTVGSRGIYGKGGGPAFEKYPQSKGPNTIVTKTAETGLGSAKDTANQLKQYNKSNNPIGQNGKQATTSTVKHRSGQTKSYAGNSNFKMK